ncbi:head GIN domain-containing protein [Novosphingobium rosa]|uniref:head GIN domain-containing protein n=1 Tax=Novosphingobium rosa TaxID=76978 RepID=UPI00083152CF|nr:head GIN domain-containing protein [Novosphingobium rosa]
MDIRKFGALIPLGLMMALSACDSADISINGEKGKPLAELDLTHAEANELVLLGPDTVSVHQGEKLAIRVYGDTDNVLRFTLKDGTLGILRKPGVSNQGLITVDVTMPAPKSLTMAGSGHITAVALAQNSQISVAGSGTIQTPQIAVTKLEVNIAGTGNYEAGGTAGGLELNIAGTGNAHMGHLKVDKAEINIAGTGDAEFASDGDIKASILGTGSVHVKGRAKCEVHAMGTGKVVCEA